MGGAWGSWFCGPGRAATAPGRTTRSREVGRRGGANKRWGTHASGRPSRSVSRLLLAGWAAAAQATLTARTTTRSLEGEGMPVGVQWFVVLKVETADFDWFRVDYLEPAKVGTGPPAGSLEPCPCSAAGPGPLSALLVAQLPVRTGHSSLARERNWCRRSFNRHWSGSANVSLGSRGRGCESLLAGMRLQTLSPVAPTNRVALHSSDYEESFSPAL